jgi:hypothetical protein
MVRSQAQALPAVYCAPVALCQEHPSRPVVTHPWLFLGSALHRQRPRDGDPAGSTVWSWDSWPYSRRPTSTFAAARPAVQALSSTASDDLSAQRETGHCSHSARRRGRAGGLRRAGRMVTRGGRVEAACCSPPIAAGMQTRLASP